MADGNKQKSVPNHDSTNDKTNLLVDDAAPLRIAQRDILTKHGYTVIGEAVNGIEAVEMYKKHRPALVIMDITLPGMDGIQATREIVSFDNGAKIIMCSAVKSESLEATSKEAILAGALDFIVKPFRAKTLLKKAALAISPTSVEQKPSPKAFRALIALYQRTKTQKHLFKMFVAKGTELASRQTASKDFDNLSSDILAAYNKIIPEMRNKVFPSDYKHVEELICNVAYALYGEICDNVASIVEQSVSFYTQYWVRNMGSIDGSHFYADLIAQRMVERFNTLPEDHVRIAITICQRYIYAFIPSVMQRDKAIQSPEMNKDIRKKVIGDDPKNEFLQAMHLNDVDYGLVSNKPIFVAGFFEAQEYLHRLRTDKGDRIIYQRKGSIIEDGIAGPIDKYEVYTENGDYNKKIYISNYGTKTSAKAPIGFILEKSMKPANEHH